jgi:hypothetical protein
LNEEDVEVITIQELSNLLKKSEIRFNDNYLNICLEYLQNIRKVKKFKVKIENNEIECVKLLREIDDDVNEKDYAIININTQIKKFDKRIDNLEKTINECVLRAKEFIRNKKKDSAVNCLKKKNLYLKAYEHYSNLKLTLEQNLLDIKSMESNQNVKAVLEDVYKTADKLKMNVNDLDNITDKLKDNKDNLNTAKEVLEAYNMDVDIVIYYINYF